MQPSEFRLTSRRLSHALPVVVINSKSSSDVKVLEVKALGPDLLGKSHHDLCCILEDVHLHTQAAGWVSSAGQAECGLQ